MKTFNRICIKNYEIRDKKDNLLSLKRGREYLTSPEEDGKVTVFTTYWVKVPAKIFAGEEIFTKD